MGSALPILFSFNETEIPFEKGVWEQSDILQSKMLPLPHTRELGGLCPYKLIQKDNFKPFLLNIQCSEHFLLESYTKIAWFAFKCLTTRTSSGVFASDLKFTQQFLKFTIWKKLPFPSFLKQIKKSKFYFGWYLLWSDI